MLHGQSAVAKIVCRFADCQVKPLSLRRFQPRSGKRGFHPLKQSGIISGDGTTTNQIVVTSRKQRRDRDRALEAFASFIEAAKLREQITQQIMRHGVFGIVRQRLSQNLFSFLISILSEQRSRFAEAAEAGPASSGSRPAETTDGLVAMAQGVNQSAGAEPCLSERWKKFSGAVVSDDCPADVAQFLQCNSHAEICIAVARVAGNGLLQCCNGIRYAPDFEASETEIVLDYRIERFEACRFAQWRDRIGRLPSLEKPCGQCKQSRRLRWRK